MDMARNVVVSVEPSKRLSEILGFPYYITKRHSVQYLLDNMIIKEEDIVTLECGETIQKHLPIVQEGV